MKGDLSGQYALDTSALIELMFSTTPGLKLKEAMKDTSVEASTTEIHIAELRYILCRRLGPVNSNECVDKLLASGYVAVEETSSLILEASKIKCERAISLADCFCLALAKKLFCRALFARREIDLAKEMKKKPFEIETRFLEDYR